VGYFSQDEENLRQFVHFPGRARRMKKTRRTEWKRRVDVFRL
jgi:hypothetical protein